MKQNHPQFTAIHRNKLSAPVAWLLKKNKIQGRILDYGCGHGKDARLLGQQGHIVEIYDPYYAPSLPQEQFDTILCIYVLNVLEPEPRLAAYKNVIARLKQGGHAYFAVRRDITEDGYRGIEGRKTYQATVKLDIPCIYETSKFAIYEFEQ